MIEAVRKFGDVVFLLWFRGGVFGGRAYGRRGVRRLVLRHRDGSLLRRFRKRLFFLPDRSLSIATRMRGGFEVEHGLEGLAGLPVTSVSRLHGAYRCGTRRAGWHQP